MVELYPHSQVYLHGIVPDHVIKARENFPLYYLHLLRGLFNSGSESMNEFINMHMNA
jgi:hypothetical protein